MSNKLIMCFKDIKNDECYDIEVDDDITAHELVIGLNYAYNLGIDVGDMTQCYLSTENPIALIRGDRKLSEFGLHNATIINFFR